MAYDHNKAIDRESVKIAKLVLELVNEHKDLIFVADPEELSAEEKSRRNEDLDNLYKKIVGVISESMIPNDYASYFSEMIGQFFTSLTGQINSDVKSVKNEILSRSVGFKSPDTGKLRANEAPFANLMLTLNRIKEETGGTDDDYLEDKKD